MPKLAVCICGEADILRLHAIAVLLVVLAIPLTPLFAQISPAGPAREDVSADAQLSGRISL